MRKLLVIVLILIVSGCYGETCKSESHIRCRYMCSSRRPNCVCGRDGKTYSNICDMKCSAHRDRKSIIADHPGPCVKDCLTEDFDAFKYRFVEWFDMLEKNELPSHYKRVDNLDSQDVLKVMFTNLDTSKNMVLEWTELMDVVENPHEHCVAEFYRRCDTDTDLILTLGEWGDCFDTHIRMMPCDVVKVKAAKHRNSGGVYYYPSCTEHGYCLPEQCNEQFCWCTLPSCTTNHDSFAPRSPDFTCQNY